MPIATTDEQLALLLGSVTDSLIGAVRRAGLAAGPATADALVAGGTTQILLSMVAERGLGLPREEVR